MPIQVACTSCAGRFRVPDNVAGKKIRCPKCKEVINVPAADAPITPAPTSPTPKPTPLASQTKPTTQKPAAPAAAGKPSKPALENWFLKTEDGESYGPVPRAELDAWYAEGRVTIDCQVLREGSEQWQWASELYPELDPASAAKIVPTTPDVAEAPAAKLEAAPEAIPKPAPPPEPSPKKVKTTAPAKPAATTPEPKKESKKEVETPAPSFFPTEEPAASPAASEDNPFAFLGGGGDTGGEAFSFSTAPSTSPATGKAGKKAAKKTSPAATDAMAAEPGEVSSKSKLTAGLLAIFLGSLGVHRFYLGYTVLGIVQLLLCGGCGIWQIIDVVMIFMGKLPDAQGRPLKG